MLETTNIIIALLRILNFAKHLLQNQVRWTYSTLNRLAAQIVQLKYGIVLLFCTYSFFVCNIFMGETKFLTIYFMHDAIDYICADNISKL